MSTEQREFLLHLADMKGAWHVHDNAIVWKRHGDRLKLEVLDVLHALCTQLLGATVAYPDPKARLAVCNIFLQRVQASIPLAQAVQAALNRRLFPVAYMNPADEAGDAAGVEPDAAGSAEPGVRGEPGAGAA